VESGDYGFILFLINNYLVILHQVSNTLLIVNVIFNPIYNLQVSNTLLIVNVIFNPIYNLHECLERMEKQSHDFSVLKQTRSSSAYNPGPVYNTYKSIT